MMDLSNSSSLFLDLIFMVAHYMSSIFYLISRYEHYELHLEETWHGSDFESTPLSSKYVNAFYFTIITMTTVGYGDITPATIQEKIYVTIFTLLACFIFG